MAGARRRTTVIAAIHTGGVEKDRSVGVATNSTTETLKPRENPQNRTSAVVPHGTNAHFVRVDVPRGTSEWEIS